MTAEETSQEPFFDCINHFEKAAHKLRSGLESIGMGVKDAKAQFEEHLQICHILKTRIDRLIEQSAKKDNLLAEEKEKWAQSEMELLGRIDSLQEETWTKTQKVRSLEAEIEATRDEKEQMCEGRCTDRGALSLCQERCKKLEQRMKIVEGSFTAEQLTKVQTLFKALGLDT